MQPSPKTVSESDLLIRLTLAEVEDELLSFCPSPQQQKVFRHLLPDLHEIRAFPCREILRTILIIAQAAAIQEPPPMRPN